jgi:hypothetical protein
VPVPESRSKLRFFPVGRNERTLPSDNEFKTPLDFLRKMDAGDLDGNLVAELKKLSREEIEEVALILMECDTKRRK